jgi:hypothetical protein
MTTILDQTLGVESLDETMGVPPSVLEAETEADPEPATATATATSDGAEASKKRGGGPRTSQGRDQSKRNSLDHGLTARKVFSEKMTEQIAQRTAEIVEEFRPRSGYQVHLAGELGRITAQLDECDEQLLEDALRVIGRAEEPQSWERHRCEAVDALIARLGWDPQRLFRALERTRQGTEWVILQWERLGEVLRDNRAWTEPQRTLAFDLLGYPLELREGNRAVPAGDQREALEALVARELALHHDRLACWLIDQDEDARQRTLKGMSSQEDADTKKLRRYKSDLTRERNRVRAELLRSLREGTQAGGSTAPKPAASAASPQATAQPPPPDPATVGRAAHAATEAGQFWERLKKELKTKFPPTVAGTPTAAVAPTPSAPAPAAARVETPAAAPGATVADSIETKIHASVKTMPRSGSRRTEEQARRERRSREKQARKAARRNGR